MKFDPRMKYVGLSEGVSIYMYPRKTSSYDRGVWCRSWHAKAALPDGYEIRMPKPVGPESVQKYLADRSIDTTGVSWRQFEWEASKNAPWDDFTPDEFPTKDVIYFIKAIGSGRLKIGWAGRLWARYRESETFCPYPTRLVGVIEGDRGDESEIHRLLVRHNVNREWFVDCDEVERFIDAHAVRTYALDISDVFTNGSASKAI